MAYNIMARFYMHPDQIGEAYCIISDNAEKDTKFELGQKVDIKLHEHNLTSSSNGRANCPALETPGLFKNKCVHCDKGIVFLPVP